MSTTIPLRLLAIASVSVVAACSSTGSDKGDYVAYDTSTGEPIELDTLCDDLARYDVVFLGEEHDNDAGHRLQLRTLTRLAELRGGVVLSMEQFEADVQGQLDLYMQGGISEREFLETSRPWGNYWKHYKPLIDFAKEHDYPVIAANIPRPLASRVSREGVEAIDGERYAPWHVWLDDPEYFELFAEIMMWDLEKDAENPRLLRGFASQCVKDEKMAESIANVLAGAVDEAPLVVHVCGIFHSDKHQGTVSRLARRRPDLSIAVVAMDSDFKLTQGLSEDERSRGEALWRVKSQP